MNASCSDGSSFPVMSLAHALQTWHTHTHIDLHAESREIKAALPISNIASSHMATCWVVAKYAAWLSSRRCASQTTLTWSYEHCAVYNALVPPSVFCQPPCIMGKWLEYGIASWRYHCCGMLWQQPVIACRLMCANTLCSSLRWTWREQTGARTKRTRDFPTPLEPAKTA